MLRKYTLWFAALCLGFGLRAQTGPDSLRAIFDQLDPNYYPSQLLHNRSPLYHWSFDPNYKASPYLFPGMVPAPLIEKGWWNMLVNDMQQSCVNPALIPDGALFRTRDSIARQAYEVPIAAVHLDFHRIIPGAVDSGYLWYDTTAQKLGPMPDTLWLDRANNVYQYYPNPDSLARLAFAAHETFAGAFTNSAVYKEGTDFSITFGLVRALFIENQGSAPSYTEMDFDNGEGFKPIRFDEPVRVHYTATSAWDSYQRILRLRLHYGSKVVESRMPLTIVPNARPADTVLYASDLPTPCRVNTNGFVPKQARISIRYANESKKLKKPVFLIEGFESAIRDYGDITYEALASGYITNAAGEEIFTQAKLLKNAFDSLVLLGYDIVYIDNQNARDYIQANALNAIKAIQWINAELQRNGSTEKPVVIGASMGGLVARYALAKMEADGCCHNVRLYGTFDSPHNGAHIPLGLQQSVKHLRDEFAWLDDMFFDGEKIKPNWDLSLNGPGARQMLVAHIDPAAKAVRNAFVKEFDSLGHPRQCRRIAILNGSEQGLAQTIAHPQKQYFKGELVLPLPIGHFIGTGWVPVSGNLVGIPAPFPLLKVAAYAENSPSGIIFERNQMGTAARLAAIIGFTHGASAAVQVLAKSLSYIPFIGGACLAVILAAQGVANIVLPGLHLANALLSVWLTAVGVPANFPNYSEAPGSTNNTPYTIAHSLNGMGLDIVTLSTPTHSFIRSVSALDVDTNDLTLHIKNNEIPLQAQGKIPFDTYWAPGRGAEARDTNMEHIRVTRELYHWLIGQIEYNPQLRHPQTGAYKTSLNGYYNYGRTGDPDAPFLKHLSSVDVVQGGRLYVNKHGTIGYAGGSQSTSPGMAYTCYTAGACGNTAVEVHNSGVFQLGEGSQGNTADMVFLKGSRLELLNGGTLRVEQGSRLLIEPGAELVIHPGAIIELAGNNAVLELQGKLSLKQDAVFAPTGSGFVRFKHPKGQSYTTAFSFGADAEIRLERTDTAQKVLEVIGIASIPPQLGLFAIDQARVQLGADALLEIAGPFSSTEVCYENLGAQPYESLRLLGQANVSLDRSYFYGGTVQLQALLTYYGNKLTLNRCKFFYPQQTGFYAEGSGITLVDCRFKGGQKGLHMRNATGASRIERSIFEDQADRGMHFSGQSAVALDIEGCDVKRATVGITVEDVQLRMSCTRSIDHAHSGLEAIHSFVDLGEEARNTLTGNAIGLELENALDLRLHNGLNHFFNNSTYFIEGSFDKHHVLGSSLLVDVYNNNMPGPASALPVAMYTSSGQTVGVSNHNNSAAHMVWQCYSQPSPYNQMVLRYPSFRVINVNGYTNTYLSDAYYDAIGEISYGDTIQDDLLAVSKLGSLLALPLSEPTENEQALLAYGLRMIMTALTNAYEQKLVPLNRAVENEPEHPYLGIVIDELNERLAETPGIDPEMLYELNLAKAHMYRMAEHYDYALTTLAEAEQHATLEALMETEYWRCVCEAEEALLHQEIEVEAYLEKKQLCQSRLLAKKGDDPLVEGITTASVDTRGRIGLIEALLPNPAADYVELRLAYVPEKVQVNVRDATGALAQVRVLRKGERRFRIALSGLSRGLYMLSVQSGERVLESKKLIKQ